MELEPLLAEARSASRLRRIEWRDQIAAYGDQGIEAVSPWLADETLAAFAVRVIDRAGLDGHPDAATRALQVWRKRATEGVQEDIAWALRRIKVAGQPEPPKPAKPLPVQAVRVRPRSTTAARRRPR